MSGCGAQFIPNQGMHNFASWYSRSSAGNNNADDNAVFNTVSLADTLFMQGKGLCMPRTLTYSKSTQEIQFGIVSFRAT